MHARYVGGILAAITTAVLAAGCSGPSDPPAAPSAPTASAPVSSDHNPTDVAFTQGMIPHHLQAVTMSNQAPTRAASQR